MILVKEAISVAGEMCLLQGVDKLILGNCWNYVARMCCLLNHEKSLPLNWWSRYGPPLGPHQANLFMSQFDNEIADGRLFLRYMDYTLTPCRTKEVDKKYISKNFIFIMNKFHPNLNFHPKDNMSADCLFWIFGLNVGANICQPVGTKNPTILEPASTFCLYTSPLQTSLKSALRICRVRFEYTIEGRITKNHFFLSHGTEKFRRWTPWCFWKFKGSKNSTHKRGYHNFARKFFSLWKVLSVSENFWPWPFVGLEIFGIKKYMSKIFRVTEKIHEGPFWRFKKILVSKKFIQGGGGGGVSGIWGNFFLSAEKIS